jgi:hypothetical protein
VAALSAPEAAQRDAAVARLRLLGLRALPALLAALDTLPDTARLAASDVLEALDDARARAALEQLAGDACASVAQRALEALGEQASASAAQACAARLRAGPASVRLSAARALVRLYAAGVVEALEPLVACLFDSEPQTPALHASALEVLAYLPAADADALRQRLAAGSTAPAARPADPEAWIHTLTARGVAAIEELIAWRARERQPAAGADAALVTALAELGPPAIPALHRALEALAGDASSRATDAGHAAAACAHRALARLASRLALYDLRERLTLAPERHLAPLLEVAQELGDAQVALAVLRRCARQPLLAARCAPTFAAIVVREHLSRRQAPWRNLHGPGEREALLALWPAQRASRARRSAQ